MILWRQSFRIMRWFINTVDSTFVVTEYSVYSLPIHVLVLGLQPSVKYYQLKILFYRNVCPKYWRTYDATLEFSEKIWTFEQKDNHPTAGWDSCRPICKHPFSCTDKISTARPKSNLFDTERQRLRVTVKSSARSSVATHNNVCLLLVI